MPRKGWTPEQKLRNRQKIIDRWRKPNDTDEQAYARYTSYMRQIASFKPKEESIEKQVKTFVCRYGEDKYQKIGRLSRSKK